MNAPKENSFLSLSDIKKSGSNKASEEIQKANPTKKPQINLSELSKSIENTKTDVKETSKPETLPTTTSEIAKPKPLLESEKKLQENKVKTSINSRKRKRRFLLFIVLLITLASFYFLYTVGQKNSKSFYKGSWKSELTSGEQSLGMKYSNYQIGENKLTQDIFIDYQQVKTTAKIETKLNLKNLTDQKASFEAENTNITNISIEVAPTLCPGQIEKCTEIKEKYSQEFRKNIIQTNKEEITIEKISDKQIIMSESGGSKVILIKN